MIYDCFTFFDELDLLEIRLAELAPVVGRFVIVEWSRTFSCKYKPSHLSSPKAKAILRPYGEKIITIKLGPSGGPRVDKCRWYQEQWQRNAMLLAWHNLHKGDVVMVSDVDEIPSRESVGEAYAHLRSKDGKKKHVVWQMQACTYFANCVPKDKAHRWLGVVAMRAATAFKRRANPQGFRDLRKKRTHPKVILIEGGWHFCWVRGGWDKMPAKVQAFSHVEVDCEMTRDPKFYKAQFDQRRGMFKAQGHIDHEVVPVGDWLPSHLVKNQKKYRHLIAEE